MSGAAVIAVAGAAALSAPWAAARMLDLRTSPRVVAVLHLLALLAMAVAPVALLLCLAGPGSLLGGTCRGALGEHGHVDALRWAALGAAGAQVLWISYAALASRRATRRAAPPALAQVVPTLDEDGLPLYVVPTERPLAYATGAGRGQVVISEGLTRLLDDDERRAVVAHEVAHVRGGHPLLLLLGRVAARALGPLPPARRAFASLRRGLEAAADEHAARVVGDPFVVATAIAKAGLAGADAGPAASFAEGSDLGYRIERLTRPSPPSRARGVAAWSMAGLLGLAVVVSQCLALHVEALWAGAAACSAVVGGIALRPFRPLLRGISA